MKRCPNCRRDYFDETLLFCLDDGEPLVDGPSLSQIDETVEQTPTRILPIEKAGNDTRGRQASKRNSLIAGVAGIIVITALGLGSYLYYGRSASTEIRSIAVLPFDMKSVEADADYLSDGLAESLIHRLSQLHQIKVSPTSTMLRFKGSTADPVEIGRQLGVDAVVTGRIVQRGEDLLVGVDLTEVASGKLLWGEQYDRKLADLLVTRREIAAQIVNSLALKVSREEKDKTENSEAYRLYLKGRYFFNKRSPADFAKSRDYFQQAIDQDPSYARAYSGLADYYGISAIVGEMPPAETWPKQEQLVKRALELDPELAEAYNSLAGLRRNYYGDFPGAEQAILRAIELDPNYAEAHVHYASHLMMVGRMDEALAERQLAVKLEPLSASVSLRLAHLLYYLKRYPESIEQYRRSLELDSDSPTAHEWLGDAYHRSGMPAQAVSEWSESLRLTEHSDLAEALRSEFDRSGFETAYRGLAERRLALLKAASNGGKYVPSMKFARLYAQLENRDEAIKWLERGATEQNAMTIDILFDPVFDFLRDDPHYPPIVKLIGIPGR